MRDNTFANIFENKIATMIDNIFTTMLGNKLSTLIDNKFASFEDKIQRQINYNLKSMKNKMDLMEVKIQVMERQSLERKQSMHQGDVASLENIKLKNMLK